MLALKFAIKNLLGAGLRTWLNVTVLSFSFVIIIWQQGIIEGWNRQARRDMIDWEIGGGVYWHENYDPYDFFTIPDSHGPMTQEIRNRISAKDLTPVLIVQATFYPEGSMQSALMKGIDPDQDILKIPAHRLKGDHDEIPAIIGSKMASNNKLKIGDIVTVRWRDAMGAYDAGEVKIVSIFKATVPTIDAGQFWIPLERLQDMTGMPNEATLLVTRPGHSDKTAMAGWQFKDHATLLADFDEMIRVKKIGGSVFYILLLSLAMLAIFDTQILSIFRRQKEIGTHMALGMTRGQVIRIFTIEGAMHGALATVVAAVWGIPLLAYIATKGMAMPGNSDDYGFAIAEKIFPTYSLGLVLGTIIITWITITIVSWLPARKIAKMRPTDAIRGKIQ